MQAAMLRAKARRRPALALACAGARTCARRRRPKFFPDTRCGSSGFSARPFAPGAAAAEPRAPRSAPPLPPSPRRSAYAERRGTPVASPRPSECAFNFFAALPSRPSRAPAAAAAASSFAAPFLRLRSPSAAGFCATQRVSRGRRSRGRGGVGGDVPASAPARPMRCQWREQTRLARQRPARPGSRTSRHRRTQPWSASLWAAPAQRCTFLSFSCAAPALGRDSLFSAALPSPFTSTPPPCRPV